MAITLTVTIPEKYEAAFLWLFAKENAHRVGLVPSLPALTQPEFLLELAREGAENALAQYEGDLKRRRIAAFTAAAATDTKAKIETDAKGLP